MNVKSSPVSPANKKYLQLVATGRDLFWKHGFKRVSIEEVCQKAGVSKMTFYRFFANKIDLAKAVFDEEVAEGLQRFRDILAEDSTPDQKIRKILLMKMQGTDHISREFLVDFYADKELGLKDFIAQKTRETWEEMLADIKTAQGKDIFRGDMKPEFIIYFSQKMTELVTDEKLLSLYESPQDLVMELTNFVSYGIAPRGESAHGKQYVAPKKK